jgi:hypothetical protein
MRHLPTTQTAEVPKDMKLFGDPIDWKLGRQATVTTSTTEAELLALAQETYRWKRMFNAVDFEPDHDIYAAWDNKQTVDSMNKEDIELKTKMKHIDIHIQPLAEARSPEGSN